jgi:serine/threonine protein kinase
MPNRHVYLCGDGEGYFHIGCLGTGKQGTASLVRSISDGKLYVRKAGEYIFDYYPSTDDWAPEVSNYREHENINRLISYEHYYPGKTNLLQATLITEFCNGGNLFSFFDRYDGKGLKVPEALIWRFLQQMLTGVEFLQKQTPKVVHCDIFPGNIFVNWPNPKKPVDPPNFYLADFGRSEVIDIPTATYTSCGSLSRSPPRSRSGDYWPPMGALGQRLRPHRSPTSSCSLEDGEIPSSPSLSTESTQSFQCHHEEIHQEALKNLEMEYSDIAGLAFYLMTGDSDDPPCKIQMNRKQVVDDYSTELRWIVQELRSWALSYARLPFEHESPDANLKVNDYGILDSKMDLSDSPVPLASTSTTFPGWESVADLKEAGFTLPFEPPYASPLSPSGSRSKAAVENQYALIKPYITAESSRRSAALTWAHLDLGKPNPYRTTPECYNSKQELIYAASVPLGSWFAAEIDEDGLIVNVDRKERCAGTTLFTDGLSGKKAAFAFTAEKYAGKGGR